MSWWDDLVEAVSPSRRDPAPRQTASITRTAVKKIVADSLKSLCEELDRENAKRDRKLDKAAEQAKAAAKDAAEAKETVERLVETARETFRDVIAELLEPHYRLLAQHLGIELPVETAKPRAAEKKRLDSARRTPPPGSAGSPLSEGAGKKQKKRALDKSSNKITATKKTTGVRRTKSKGAKPCRKK